jgi:hypothetical protein
MDISNEAKVILELQSYFGIKFNKVPRKKVFYQGYLSNRDEVLICTPEAKLQPKGFGWVDLTEIQINFLQSAVHAVFAFRLKNSKTYYLNFNDLEPFLTENTRLYNEREKDHWKLHIYPDYIKILGNNTILSIIPNDINEIGINN